MPSPANDVVDALHDGSVSCILQTPDVGSRHVDEPGLGRVGARNEIADCCPPGCFSGYVGTTLVAVEEEPILDDPEDDQQERDEYETELNRGSATMVAATVDTSAH